MLLQLIGSIYRLLNEDYIKGLFPFTMKRGRRGEEARKAVI